MTKTTSKNLSERLLQYGALSAAALGVADASGQIVYTDITDIVLNVGEMFDVDITQLGTDDIFTVNNPSGLAGGNAAIVFPSSGGAFVGITAYGFEYPALMSFGQVIDGAAGYTAAGQRGDLNYYGCAYSNSNWCGDVNDGYLGVSFDLSGNTHYGWIRLDTDVNGDNLITIKDFAYEATPDTQILAGDNALSVDDFELRRITHFYDVDTKILTLDSQTPLNQMTVYNILGQEALKVGLSDTQHSEINMSVLEAGIYIARITGHNNATKTIKLVIK
ncbi:MAG: T9SS type A sorting domain-containing protein [Bacteroidia bacterium]|nr:T9SS type A sorting domain-containing protein [Bacteroidia bacterium]NND51491.1 T9SS type A sorting domain-containing protein [Flavobacteriaceae bacterium]